MRSPRSLERGVRIATLLALAVAALLVLHRAYDFGQTRFFTVDEFQTGHATWLVAQGQRPYVDFYEHHFPLSYLLHAPAVAGEAPFAERALRLRRIVFAYLLGLAAILGLSALAATRDPHLALLAVSVPPCVGFGLMSAVDYRPDNFAAFQFLACLALLEANRSLARRSLALICGLLAGLAVFHTQKIVLLAGGAIPLLLVADAVRWRGGPEREDWLPLIRHPGSFLLGGALVALAMLALALRAGALHAALRIAVDQASRHDDFYPAVALWPYVRPYLEATLPSTLTIGACAALFFALRPRGFWLAPLLAALAGGWLATARYPYYYVYLCLLVGLCAVRGFGLLVVRVRPEAGTGRALHPLLYLLPLLALPQQLGFLERASDNRHQLAALAKIEALSEPGDAVIDSAGGALFRDHASYHWYHGRLERKLYQEYLGRDLLADFRRSRAPLWIWDMRVPELPDSARGYLRAHYVRLDGRLFGLGYETPPTGDAPVPFAIDVVREGRYHLLAAAEVRGEPAADFDPRTLDRILLDGQPVAGRRIYLTAGAHRLTLPPRAPALLISYFPAEAYRAEIGSERDHSMLFEYEERSP